MCPWPEGYKYVWDVGRGDEWYGAFLRFFHNGLPFQPPKLGIGAKWWFWEVGRWVWEFGWPERYRSLLASSLSLPKTSRGRKGNNAIRGYENSNLVFFEVWLYVCEITFVDISFLYFSFLLRKEEWRIRTDIFFNYPFYFEIIIEPHAVIRNNTESSACPFYPGSPHGNILSFQEFDVDGIIQHVSLKLTFFSLSKILSKFIQGIAY